MYCQLEWGVDVSSVYVYCAICETYLLHQYSIDLLSLRLWGVDVSQYMCNLLYVMVIWCNGIPLMHSQFEWGVRYIFSLCVFYYM